ncbi:hypothetical protein STEG23_000738 [Scotinomys teguina]
MAIAHLATEYVFSDFLLKEPTEPKFKGLRLELAVDKMVTCIAVGLPLLLISLAFAQEISIGSDPGFPTHPWTSHSVSFRALGTRLRPLRHPGLSDSRYPDKLLLPEFFLLATGRLCGFILLGGCAAEELPAERVPVWNPPTVAAQVPLQSVWPMVGPQYR